MKKNILIKLVTCLLFSITVILVLVTFAWQIKNTKNSFLRTFPSHPVLNGDTFNIKYNNYYIAGVTKSHIYLGNYTAPLHVLIITRTLTDSQHVKIRANNIDKQLFWSARVKIDSPFFYLYDGTVPIIYKGQTKDWIAKKILSDSLYFRDFLPMSSTTSVLKSLSAKQGENIIGKVSFQKQTVDFNNSLLSKQIDGVFCTDGMMLYNHQLNRFIYLYYYRNQFIQTDSTLNLINRHNTIDTNTIAKIKVGSYGDNNTRTMASPPLFVNLKSTTIDEWLFINSNLLAKNEHPQAHQKAAVIDVYNLIDGQYRFSFYLYKHKGKSIQQIVSADNELIVLYGHTIGTFKLRPAYFSSQGGYAADPK